MLFFYLNLKFFKDITDYTNAYWVSEGMKYNIINGKLSV